MAQPDRTLDPVSIHSARLFVGETLKISPTSGATASVEALFNLNREDNALDASTGHHRPRASPRSTTPASSASWA